MSSSALPEDYVEALVNKDIMPDQEYEDAVTAKTAEYHVIGTKHVGSVEDTTIMYMEIAGADDKKPSYSDLVKSFSYPERTGNIIPANGSLYLATDTAKIYTWDEDDWNELVSFGD